MRQIRPCLHCGFCIRFHQSTCACPSPSRQCECTSDSRGLHPSASTHALCILLHRPQTQREREGGRERERQKGRDRGHRATATWDACPPSVRTGTLMIWRWNRWKRGDDVPVVDDGFVFQHVQLCCPCARLLIDCWSIFLFKYFCFTTAFVIEHLSRCEEQWRKRGALFIFCNFSLY